MIKKEYPVQQLNMVVYHATSSAQLTACLRDMAHHFKTESTETVEFESICTQSSQYLWKSVEKLEICIICRVKTSTEYRLLTDRSILSTFMPAAWPLSEARSDVGRMATHEFTRNLLHCSNL
jgi:hypothetical protein